MKKSKGMQLGALLAAMLLLSMVFVPVASAQGANDNKDKKILEIIRLQPEASSEVILDSFEAILWSDDSVTVQSSGQKQAETPALYFHWEINLSKKTYKTTKLAVSDLIKRTPINTKIEKNKGKLTPDAVVVAVTPGTYTATVQVVTDDLVGEDLAETTHKLNWTVNAGGTVNWNWRSVSAWAANPSSFGTHWFVDTYGFVGSVTYSPDQTSVFSEAQGKYYNWDFGDDNQATYADHWSKIQGRNDGGFNYWWGATHSGEYWWLLDGDVYAS